MTLSYIHKYDSVVYVAGGSANLPELAGEDVLVHPPRPRQALHVRPHPHLRNILSLTTCSHVPPPEQVVRLRYCTCAHTPDTARAPTPPPAERQQDTSPAAIQSTCPNGRRKGGWGVRSRQALHVRPHTHLRNILSLTTCSHVPPPEQVVRLRHCTCAHTPTCRGVEV